MAVRPVLLGFQVVLDVGEDLGLLEHDAVEVRHVQGDHAALALGARGGCLYGPHPLVQGVDVVVVGRSVCFDLFTDVVYGAHQKPRLSHDHVADGEHRRHAQE